MARTSGLLPLLPFLVLAAGCREDPTGPPAGTTFTRVAVGAFHSCALDSEGAAWCWGANGRGQLGAERGDDVIDRPTRVLANGAFTALATGRAHTCGILSSGSLRCWGGNGAGQLGDGTLEDRSAPVFVDDSDQPWVEVTAGAEHTCALDRGRVAFCWGANDAGQLGDGGRRGRRRPGPVVGGLRFASLSAGARHTCGITLDGDSYCWGANGSGQLGANLLGDSPTPTRVIGPRLRSIDAGRSHTCGLDDLGRAWCWGGNERGALGIGGALGGVRTSPVRVLTGAFFARVTAGHGPWSCGLTAGGELLCWGELRNRTGPDALVRNAPGPVGPPELRWRELGVGDAHACGLTQESDLQCWGRGFDRSDPPSPVR
ncbi:MAG: hypothetical protein PVI57_02765 [Gemmatimonadota bacterium]